MQTISRLYSTEDTARKASDELTRRGYRDVHVFAGRQGEEAASASRDTIVKDMVKAYVVRSEAEIYAERVANGSSLVVVHAPFSGGAKATRILNSYGPIDKGVPEPDFSIQQWDDAVPLSSALRLPLLTKTALPFEAVVGVPSLLKRKHIFGSARLSDNATPFSSATGMPVLTNNGTPLSSLLGFQLLKKGRVLTK